MIRLMLPHELDTVLDLWVEMCQEAGLKPNKVWWIQNTLNSLSGNAGIFVVENESGKIVGFTDYSLVPVPAYNCMCGITKYFFVTSSERKYGLAKEMMDFVVNFYRSSCVQKIMIHSNSNSMVAWDNHGFNEVSTIHEMNIGG